MALALPNLSFLNSQMSNLGKAVKQAGPSLFSATQTAGPDNSQRNSMMTDFMDAQTSLRFPSTNMGNLRFGSESQHSIRFPSDTPSFNGTTGAPSASLGGDWAGVDQWSSAIDAAAAEFGLDPDQIKAVMKLESGGDPNASGADGVWGPMQVNSKAWGYGEWMTDPNANIFKGAEILKHYMDAAGGDFREALRGYHGYGSDGYTTDTQYADIVMQNYNQLKSGAVAPINGMWGGNATGNSIVDFAKQFVGVAYNWGAIPGAGQDPWQTGWDCSGMTYWMDQTKGSGQLPMGSHYQYQYAQQTGQLFTDMSQLQPGDLVFIDTGWQGGAGAELNRAGHVGIYIGNGQMIHAANPSQGTIISPLSGYGGVLGAMHGTWGGGSGYQSPYMSGGAASSSGDFLSRMRALAGYR